MSIMRTLFGSVLVLSTASAQARPPIVGYLPVFKGPEAVAARAPIDRYSHINLAFANPGRDGHFVVDGRLACMADETGTPLTLDRLRALVATLHADGVRVLLSLGGGLIPACSGDWAALLRPERRDALVAGLVALVDDAGLDGIDVDLEGELLTAIDRAGDFTPFVTALSAAMRTRGKLLGCATASYEGGMVPVATLPSFDLVGVMSYDAIGPTWGTPGDEHATLAMAARDVALWRARGVAPERLMLGVPFYGRGFGAHAGGPWSYHRVVAADPDAAATGDLIGEPCATCDYVTFNGPATIAAKAALARQAGGGVMVWEISEDSDDAALLGAVERGLAPPRTN